MIKNKGSITEDLVSEISETMFLRDFVVRNPKFKKKSGQEKEVTDLLVPFDSKIISIQVKSKFINTDSVSQEVIDDRINRVLDDAIGQLANTKK